MQVETTGDSDAPDQQDAAGDSDVPDQQEDAGDKEESILSNLIPTSDDVSTMNTKECNRAMKELEDEEVAEVESAPPNQVLAGLALFLSLFIMGPTVSAMNEQGVQPYLKGDKTQSQAFKDGVKPLQDFMWRTTRDDEVALMIRLSGEERPQNRNDVELTTLIPAFVLSELRAAMIIGFVIFIPFLLIDMVVSASLMSLGMMMLPPVTVALPFKLLLFVLVNGWGLILTALVASYR
jgi:flagellar biosynthetic protein FliP